MSLDIPQENATRAKELGSRKVFGMQTWVEKEREKDNLKARAQERSGKLIVKKYKKSGSGTSQKKTCQSDKL